MAAFFAVTTSFLFPVDLALTSQIADIQTIPQGIGKIIHSLLVKIVINLLSSLIEGNYLDIAGGSLLLIPLACSLFGIPNDIAMHVVDIGFIVGVIQDCLETLLNSSSDVIFSAVADYYKQAENNPTPK